MLNIKTHSKPSLTNPTLIAGLPGIGNVSKLAIDFIIDKLKPELVAEITSNSFPPAVFIDDNNIVDLPTIKLYALKGKQDLLLLTGDVQPASEEASFELANKVIELAKLLGCKKVLTLGGVGRSQPPKKPKLYCAATSKEVLENFKAQTNAKFHDCDSISNIMGLAGLLLGAAKSIGSDGVTILVDTFAHPAHFGLEESKYLLELLKELFSLNIKPKELDDDIEDEKKDKAAITQALKQRKLANIQKQKDTSYIG